MYTDLNNRLDRINSDLDFNNAVLKFILSEIDLNLWSDAHQELYEKLRVNVHRIDDIRHALQMEFSDLNVSWEK
jgi:hypothetical protein